MRSLGRAAIDLPLKSGCFFEQLSGRLRVHKLFKRFQCGLEASFEHGGAQFCCRGIVEFLEDVLQLLFRRGCHLFLVYMVFLMAFL